MIMRLIKGIVTHFTFYFIKKKKKKKNCYFEVVQFHRLFSKKKLFGVGLVLILCCFNEFDCHYAEISGSPLLPKTA